MRTVITISLNGNAYQLDAVGYEELRAYLHVAEQRLAGNPDQREILADLEQAIADKCGRYLGPYKNVVAAEEIAAVLREMGPVDGGAADMAASGAPSAGAGGPGRTNTSSPSGGTVDPGSANASASGGGGAGATMSASGGGIDRPGSADVFASGGGAIGAGGANASASGEGPNAWEAASAGTSGGPNTGPNPGANAGISSGPSAGWNAGANAHSNADPNNGPSAWANIGSNAGATTGQGAGSSAGFNAGGKTGPDGGSNAGANIGSDGSFNAGSTAASDAGSSTGSTTGPNKGANMGSNTDYNAGGSGYGDRDTASAGSTAGAAGASSAGGAGGEQAAGGEPLRRLYQIREGAMISGVCKGLAAYLNIDVSIIRILFVLLVVLTGGVWILVYLVMMFVIPYAQTSEQHAAAHGWPFNAEELVARAKAHYAQFRNSEKWQRKQWKEQRRMWKYQHRQWKEQQRAWERWGSAQGAPPPPPPWSAGQQQPPPSASYTAHVVNGVVSPITELLRALLFIGFLVVLISLVTHHRIFGWWLPHDVPLWLGVVILIVLYRAIAAPLHHARYAAYYGSPFMHGWLALVGAVVWLSLLTFLCWLAWEHWSDVRDFLQNFADGLRSMIQHKPTTLPAGPERTAAYSLAWMPTCFLYSWFSREKVQAHGEIDGTDMLGESTDGDVVHTGLGDLAHGFE